MHAKSAEPLCLPRNGTGCAVNMTARAWTIRNFLPTSAVSGIQAGYGIMGTKDTELLGRLSEEEQQSLRKLCRCCCKDQKIPGDHAEKLLILGLAEMTCGGLGATSYGRQAAASVRVN